MISKLDFKSRKSIFVQARKDIAFGLYQIYAKSQNEEMVLIPWDGELVHLFSTKLL